MIADHHIENPPAIVAEAPSEAQSKKKSPLPKPPPQNPCPDRGPPPDRSPNPPPRTASGYALVELLFLLVLLTGSVEVALLIARCL